MLVAYRYREPSVIRSDKMDQLSLPALDPQCFPLAGVRGVVPICNRNGTKLIYKTFQLLFENEMIKNIPFSNGFKLRWKERNLSNEQSSPKRYNLKKYSVRWTTQGRKASSFQALAMFHLVENKSGLIKIATIRKKNNEKRNKMARVAKLRRNNIDGFSNTIVAARREKVELRASE